MRRFLAKLLALAALAAALAVVLALLAYSSPVRRRFGPEVFRAIRVASETRPEATTLLLGDSMAHQIFATGPAMPPRVAVATCNQAVTPLGNRLLLDRWLAQNPQARDVAYVLLPASLHNDGARLYTFHYFLHPFAETGLLDAASPAVRDHLKARFGALVLRNASLRHLLYRNDRLYGWYERHIVREPASPSVHIPSIVRTELRAMRQACDRAGVRFHLVCPPMPRGCVPSAATQTRIEADLADVLDDPTDYFRSLRALPDDDFEDGVHLTRERLRALRDTLRDDLLEKLAPNG